jgi:hypothetical protein
LCHTTPAKEKTIQPIYPGIAKGPDLFKWSKKMETERQEFSAMRSSEINELAEALSKAQGVISAAEKERENPFFKSKYADLSNVWEACRKPLSDNGLAVIQTTVGTKGQIELETNLVHKSGQFIKARIPVIQLKQDMQGLGAAITYARRFSLASMVGVYQDDSDGQGDQQEEADHVADVVPVKDVNTEAFIQRCMKKVADGKGTAAQMVSFMKTRIDVTKEIEEIINSAEVK